MIDSNDLRINVSTFQTVHGLSTDVERSVTVTHIPTGMTITCSSERTTNLNVRRAIQMLEEVIHELPRRAS